MSRPRRKIGGVWFQCLSRGSWLSEDGRLAIVHMMAGTPYDQWELWETNGEMPDEPDCTDFLCGNFLGGSISFSSPAIADDVSKYA